MAEASSEIESALAEIKAVIEGRRLPGNPPTAERRGIAEERFAMGGSAEAARSRPAPENGGDRLIRIDLQQLANLLGSSLASMRERVSLNAARGRWRVVSSGQSPLEDVVEIPASDLNKELDRAYDGDSGVSASEDCAPNKDGDADLRNDARHGAIGEEDRALLKQTLIDAHGRLVALQSELRAAKAELADLREDRAALRSIAALVDEWRTRQGAP